MAQEYKPAESRSITKENWYEEIRKTITLFENNPIFSEIRVELPMGVLIKFFTYVSSPNGFNREMHNRIGKFEKIILGWEADHPEARLSGPVEFFIKHDKHFGRTMGFKVELFPWDKTRFKKTETGITHRTRNDRGVVELKQIVASPKALPKVLVQFMNYCGNFAIKHCEFPATIKNYEKSIKRNSAGNPR